MPRVQAVDVSDIPQGVGENLTLVDAIEPIDAGDAPMVVISVGGRLIPNQHDNRPVSLILTLPAATLLADLLRKGVKEYLRPPPEEG